LLKHLTVSEFIETLSAEFSAAANEKRAAKQKQYMRQQFDYFGLTSEERRNAQKPFLVKAFLPEKRELVPMVKTLWEKPQREFQYFAQELAFKYIKQASLDDIALYEYMVSHKSWWDTVDYIANRLMGGYFKTYPEERQKYVDKWLASNNIWLQRSALLFQLKYKSELDVELLEYTIQPLLGSKEFFINKAIGWVLREYSRTDADWVWDFVERTPRLSNLSKKEGLRLIKKT